jgi:hypothetical protein
MYLDEKGGGCGYRKLNVSGFLMLGVTSRSLTAAATHGPATESSDGRRRRGGDGDQCG